MKTTHVSPDIDIHTFIWLDHESVGFPDGHVQALELFRDSVVRPSLRAVERQIDQVERSNEPDAVFLHDDLASLFAAAVDGYILIVQSMWERGLRAMLILREKKLCAGEHVEALKRAPWSGGKGADLQLHFERLLGVPVAAFDSFDDLDLLQNLGSAVRHGDGAAARKVHMKAPSLWWNWLPPGTRVEAGPFTYEIPEDWPQHPSFNKVTLTEAVLEQMIPSVSAFLEDLEIVRCSSFRRKSVSVQRKLNGWPKQRELRVARRVWSPG